MHLARETVELLVQTAIACHPSDDQRGMRDREWTALRFLARANRFSRTPSALADYLGSTRAMATQIIKILEERSLVVRRPSDRDKRSVVLCVTAPGERLLAQHDPIRGVVDAVATLVTADCVKLRDSLHAILNRIDTPLPQAKAGSCRDCIFLSQGRRASEFQCRLHRAPIMAGETDLLCTSFERADSGSRPG
ncbi:MarR family transcriptional regulator [Bradyrhizobium diazoefficiens]|nr:MarR family transcriptional regulator [Bradyrhizobium diazoefficiens]MBR0775883.1 MarR family transcriptional regulator [Bradyrhizobium diazoefficiens]